MKNGKTTMRQQPTTAPDWSEIRRRVETAHAAIERRLTPTVEETNAILKARATALAREPEEKNAAEVYLEVMEFLLAHETYGFESSYIREVYPLKELTPLPGTPPFVLA